MAFVREDPEVVIEFQQETISRYGLEFKNGCFHMVPLQTECLALDACTTTRYFTAKPASGCCTPGVCC